MKSVLITGSNKGIGLETAKQLSGQGLFVYMGCRDFNKGVAAVKQLKEEGFKNLEAVEIDVTKPQTISSAKQIVEEGHGRLDVLINNAGISGVVPQSALLTLVDNYNDVTDVNFYGVVRVTQNFINLLRKSDAPRIVNVSTSLGSLSLQSDRQWPVYDYGIYVIYASSKAAMNMYTVHLAYELRDTAFKVNAVCPGYTKTDFTNHIGGEVGVAAKRIIKYALVDQSGPTGKFFSEETNPATGEIPW